MSYKQQIQLQEKDKKKKIHSGSSVPSNANETVGSNKGRSLVGAL
jgi:hypothetical protein